MRQTFAKQFFTLKCSYSAEPCSIHSCPQHIPGLPPGECALMSHQPCHLSELCNPRLRQALFSTPLPRYYFIFPICLSSNRKIKKPPHVSTCCTPPAHAACSTEHSLRRSQVHTPDSAPCPQMAEPWISSCLCYRCPVGTEQACAKNHSTVSWSLQPRPLALLRGPEAPSL